MYLSHFICLKTLWFFKKKLKYRKMRGYAAYLQAVTIIYMWTRKDKR